MSERLNHKQPIEGVAVQQLELLLRYSSCIRATPVEEDTMDLEAPLRTIASPVEAEVLRVLAGADTEFTAPQVQRLAATSSPYGVRKALARLAESGLVIPDRYGTTYTWRANRRHLLWPAIEIAAGARGQLLDRIRDEVQQERGVSAYLYGSMARHETSPESDVDVLLVFPDDRDTEQIIDFAHELSDNIAAWTGNRGQIYSVTRSGLADMVRRGDSIVTSLRADAIPLVGPELARLLLDLEPTHG
jgi:predicted nucleotidyltransferase